MSVSLESLTRDLVADAPRVSVAAELLSFLLVGAAAALGFVGLSTTLIALDSGVADWLMSALCYAVLIVPAYLAHRRFSFRSQAPHRVALPRYAMVQLSGLTLAALFSFVCYGVFGLPALPASLLVIALTSGVNFVVLRLWAFAGRG